MILSPDQEDQFRREWAFRPCSTVDELSMWLQVFLKLDFPAGTVDPESNSSPLDLCWEVYSLALRGGDPDVSRIMAYASRDSYKCVEKGTRILTRDRGLVQVEDIILGEMIWTGTTWRSVTDWVHDGEKESRRLVLDSGNHLCVSPIHRVWAWKADADRPEWCVVADLTPEDVVAVDSPTPADEIVNDDEFDIGYLCGILIGDGSLTQIDKGGYMAVVTCSDPVVREAWERGCLRYAGKNPRSGYGKNYRDFIIYSKRFVEQMREWGLSAKYSWQKTVPKICWTSRSYMRGFISGVFDTDGAYDKGGVLFSMTSEVLLQEMQVILAALGVFSSRRSNKKLYCQQRHTVHHLIVTQHGVPDLDRAGIRRRAVKAGTPSLPSTADAHDVIPIRQARSLIRLLIEQGNAVKSLGKGNYRTVTRDKLRRSMPTLWEERDFWERQLRFRWRGVRSVEVESANFYDLTVDTEHCYWSNGLISHNTLVAATLEVLMILHCGRSVVHLAAIVEQSQKAQQYVHEFFDLPYLCDFRIGDASKTRDVNFVRYQRGKDYASNINAKAWKRLPDVQRRMYDKHAFRVELAVCNLAGVNSKHAPYMCVDEVDVVGNPKAYKDARMIPSSRRGQLAITLLTSTRKSATGKVQEEIDAAPRTKLQLRHWNLIDITESCPPERHLPDEPRIPIYVRDDTLEALSEAEHGDLPPLEQQKFRQSEGYTGCLKNCRLFAPCQGRLATEQKSRANLLKTVESTQSAFRDNDPDEANAQLLCRKPSSFGLIFPRLDVTVHLITPARAAEMITGEKYDPHMDRQALIRLWQRRGVEFWGGLDFGFTHAFTVTTAAEDGHRLFVFDYLELQQAEEPEQIEQADYIREWKVGIYPDMGQPGSIVSFRKAGFKMREWNKKAGTVLDSINAVKKKLKPALGGPAELFFVQNDRVLALLSRLQKYHWKTSPTGQLMDEPDKSGIESDAADGLRYLVYNRFPPRKRKQRLDEDPVQKASQEAAVPVPPHREEWRQQILAHAGVEPGAVGALPGAAPPVVRRGRLFFSG